MSGYGVKFEIDKAQLGRVIANIEALPRRYLKPALRHSVKAAAGEVKAKAKMLAPRRKGHLRAALIVKPISAKIGRSKDIISAAVGPKFHKYADGSDPGRYGHLVEGGTQRHVIRPKFKKVLAWKGKVAATKVSFDPASGVSVAKTGRNKRFQAFTQQVNHPGIRPRNFLRNAAYIAQGAATRAFIRELQARYTKAASDYLFSA